MSSPATSRPPTFRASRSVATTFMAGVMERATSGAAPTPTSTTLPEILSPEYLLQMKRARSAPPLIDWTFISLIDWTDI